VPPRRAAFFFNAAATNAQSGVLRHGRSSRRAPSAADVRVRAQQKDRERAMRHGGAAEPVASPPSATNRVEGLGPGPSASSASAGAGAGTGGGGGSGGGTASGVSPAPATDCTGGTGPSAGTPTAGAGGTGTDTTSAGGADKQPRGRTDAGPSAHAATSAPKGSVATDEESFNRTVVDLQRGLDTCVVACRAAVSEPLGSADRPKLRAAANRLIDEVFEKAAMKKTPQL